MRILVAEDEALVAMLIEYALEDAGHKVVHAPNARQALTMAAQADSPFEMLMTDLRMPGMAGEELARQMRTRQPGLPVLVLTGSPPAGGLAGLAIGDGPTELLIKPVNAADIVRGVERLAARAGVEQRQGAN